MSADLASRVRVTLADHPVSEMKMFGGTAFLLNGNMAASASKRGLMLRVGKDAAAGMVGRGEAKQVEMRGRPMAGYVRVDEAGLADRDLARWLDLALAFVRTLPAKAEGLRKAAP